MRPRFRLPRASHSVGPNICLVRTGSRAEGTGRSGTLRSTPAAEVLPARFASITSAERPNPARLLARVLRAATYDRFWSPTSTGNKHLTRPSAKCPPFPAADDSLAPAIGCWYPKPFPKLPEHAGRVTWPRRISLGPCKPTSPNQSSKLGERFESTSELRQPPSHAAAG